MAISVSCPSCERELKVKDELAGRKVKCPKCGKGVVVPGDEEDEDKVATPPPRKASRQEEDDDEERPRKKKKKKQKNNNNLLILSGLGGVLLLGVVVVVIIVSTRKEKPPPPQEDPVAQQQVQGVPPVIEKKPEEKGRVGRGPRAAADQQIIQNDLRQLAIFWNNYRTEHNGRPPKDWNTFKPYLRTAGGIVQGIEEGKYKIVLNAQPNSAAVLAYEWPQDDTGQHIVAMGDGSVDRILHQDLLAKVPNAGK